MIKDPISYDEFTKLDIRVATVVSVDPIDGADRLYKLVLDAGELGDRTVAAGIKQWYSPEELVGRQVIYLANLEPKILKGVESQGMILAADDGEAGVLLQSSKEVANGSAVR